MKTLAFLVACIPFFCLAQIRTEHYTSTKTKYLELVEISDKLLGISKPVDSSNNYNALDSLYYFFKLTPYPDQLKKYEIKSSLRIIISYYSDTLLNATSKVSDDSSYIAFPVHPRHNSYNIKIYVNTDYKRSWRKSFKHISEQVVFTNIDRLICPKLMVRDVRTSTTTGCMLYYNWPEEILNYTRKKHSDYTPDQLIIRMVPGVN